MMRISLLFFALVFSFALTMCSDGGGSNTPAVKSWGTPELIETYNSGSASLPKVAFDKEGNANAVWSQYDGGRSNIWSNRYTKGSGWGIPELIEEDNEGNAVNPDIAFDSEGNAISVWEQNDGAFFNIRANRYTSGFGWETPELLELSDVGDATKAEIVFGGDNNAIAVWSQDLGTNFSVIANRYVQGTGWSGAVLVETDDSGDAYQPKIAGDINGNAIAVWHQSDGVRTNIMANRYAAESGWGSALLIEADDTGNADNPNVAVDNNGNAIAVWTQYDGSDYRIFANRYTAGSGWGSAVRIENNNYGSAYWPYVAIDSNGNAIAVWTQADGTVNSIYANRYTEGSGWGTAELIETNDVTYGEKAIVKFDPYGNAVAVWYDDDGVRYNIWSNSYNRNSGWGTAVQLEFDDGSCSFMDLAVDENGNAIAVWNQSDGTRDNIWANRYE